MNNNEFTTSNGCSFEIDSDGDVIIDIEDCTYYLSEQDLEEMLSYVRQYAMSESNNQEPRFTERGKNDKF